MKDALWPYVNGSLFAATLIGQYQVLMSESPVSTGEVVALLFGYIVGGIMSLTMYRVPHGWRNWWFTHWDSAWLGVRTNARAWVTTLVITGFTLQWLPWPTVWPLVGYLCGTATLALFIDWIWENLHQVPH